jgi:cytoskeleton protein RodZ
MAASDTTQEEDIKSTSNGPGDLLQAGRIEMGMSLEDVASRMHLSTGIVEAIEENNFSNITAPIFVKGYLRAYARIVSLDENEMIQQYVEYYSNEDPPIASTSKLLPEISTSDRRIKWVTYLVIILLSALLTVWWWNKYQTTTDVVSLDAQQTTEIDPVEIAEETQRLEIEAESEVTVDTSVADTPRLTVSAPVIDSVAVTDTSAADTPVVVTDSSVVTDSPETPVEINVPAAVEVDIEVAVLTTAEPVPAPDDTVQIEAEVESEAEQESDAEAVELSDTITRMAAGSDQLGLVVNADSWVEINDANGNRLVYRLARAYQKFNLTGKAPFTIFLGNGYGVEVTFNDEPIDIISRIRSDNTVWIKVGG